MNQQGHSRKPAHEPMIEASFTPEFQHLLDSLPFYAMLVDAKHRILMANQAVKDDLNVDPCEIIGGFCPKVIHDVDGEYPGCPLEEVLRKGGDTGVEKRFRDTSTGKWMHSVVYPTGLTAPDGSAVYLHFARNISDEKRQEQELERSLEHHRAVGELLRELQGCHTERDALTTLVNHVVGLSWMGLESRACGFLVRPDRLEMVVWSNLTEVHLKTCSNLRFGECLCGKAAQTGQTVYCHDLNEDHTVRYDGMEEHGHAVLPLIQDGDVLAVVNYYLPAGDLLEDSQKAFLAATCSVTATALSNIRARNEVGQAQETLLKTERRLLARIIGSQEEERKRIARDLHDQLGQSLSASLLEIQALEGEDAAPAEMLTRLKRTVGGLIDEVKSMAFDLRPSILDHYGIHSALERYTQDLAQRAQLNIDYEYACHESAEDRLDPPVEVVLYRIAQEALNNVVRHAGASKVSVVLLRTPDAVTLLVEDNGHGFDAGCARAGGPDCCLGLIGMEERANLLGGKLVVESAPGKGTVVRAEIPLGEGNDVDQNHDSR